ncbi:MAG: hypothetical protein Q9207_001503 [Kuettlingeria erythrocarpa]
MISRAVQLRPLSVYALSGYASQRAKFSTWRPIQQLNSSDVHTFRAAAFSPSLPAKFPSGTVNALPAAAKWFQEPWPTFNSSYLGQFGDVLIPLEFTHGSVFQRAEAPFSIFLDWAARASSDSPQRLYVAQARVNQLPAPLQDDLPTPELVAKAGKGDVYDASIWLGIAPTVTSLHRDPNPNLYMQLAGRKAVRLLEPDVGQSIFAAVQMELGRQSSSKFRGDEMMKGKEKDMLEIRVWSDNPVENQDGQKGMEVTLEAGESMFIPQGWWHSIKSTGTGCTASVGLLP